MRVERGRGHGDVAREQREEEEVEEERGPEEVAAEMTPLVVEEAHHEWVGEEVNALVFDLFYNEYAYGVPK